MKLFILLILFFISTRLSAEITKTVFNPFTGKLDYITVLSSATLPSGSTQYIQNSSSPTISTQVFNVQSGTFSATGFTMTDTLNCTWQVTVSTLGAIITALNQCPVVIVSRPCTTGMSLGLLLGITCP